MRSLSQSEYEITDSLKTSILFSIKPSDNISEEIIKNKVNASHDNSYLNKYQDFVKTIKGQIDKDLTTDDLKQLKSYFYSMVYA